MSSVDPIVPGAALAYLRLLDRIGASVWSAEDTRSGRIVAVKILTRQLPKDAAKREALLRDVRLAAALYHSFLVNVLEIVDAGDVLLMVMDLVDGQPLSRLAKTKPADRTEFFRIAYQLVDVVKFLHLRELTHLNITGDSVLVSTTGQVRLAGLNVNNLLKRDSSAIFQQRAGDARSVAYMAPEQIAGDAVTQAADLWSVGVVLYELATAKLPFSGASATELAQRIVEGQPASPKAARPDIDPHVLGVMGRCLFKDPYRRHKGAKSMLDEIVRAEPDAQKFAHDIAKSGAGAPAVQANERDALLFVADVANYDELAADDPGAATKAAARMQQLLGESVYLFDGVVVDPFGRRMVAELPSVENAVEAARKGEFDFSPKQQEGEPLQVRMLLHAGRVTVREGSLSVDTVDRAAEVLEQLPPLKLFISEEFLKRGRGTLRLRDGGARAGMKLFHILEPERDPALDTAPEPTTAEIEEAEAEAVRLEAEHLAALKKRRRNQLAAVGAAAVVMLGGVVYGVRRHEEPQAIVAPRRNVLPPASAKTPRKVLVTIDGADAATVDATRRILDSWPEVRIAEAAASDVTRFPATLQNGSVAVGKDAPVPAPDAPSAIAAVLHAVATSLKLAPREVAPPALAAYAEAVAAADNAKKEAAIRAALKADPQFLAAQLLALEFFDGQGKEKDAVAAAKQIVALDPSNVAAARRLARAELKEGDLAAAFDAYEDVLRYEPRDLEALNVVARYAAAANDQAVFRAALARLAKLPANEVAAHPPDLLVGVGKIEDAVSQYTDIEVNVPRNAALSLKIGRLSVLRHSLPIAELELQKLEELDPKYAAHILKAYIAADARREPQAQAELKIAQDASTPGDDYWTSAAEVSALAGDAPTAMRALESAAERKEPTAQYVLSNRLLAQLLVSDPRFARLRGALQLQQEEIRAALAKLSL